MNNSKLVRVGDDMVAESDIVSHLDIIVGEILDRLPVDSGVRTTLESVLAVLRSPAPESDLFPAIVETEVDFPEEDNPESTAVFVIRHVSGVYYHNHLFSEYSSATQHDALWESWESNSEKAGKYFSAKNAFRVRDYLQASGQECRVLKREHTDGYPI